MEVVTAPEGEKSAGRILKLTANDLDLNRLTSITKALGSDKRLGILRLLGEQEFSVLDIAEALDLPRSTATLHIKILEKAGLIQTDLQPAKRGLQKLCARTYDQIIVQLSSKRDQETTALIISMPIGAYVEAQVKPTCGLRSEKGLIGQLDDPSSFFEPERIYAQMLWFRTGFVEYRFPNHLPGDINLDGIELSFEACSDAPLNHANWLSDITVWMNGVEIGSWTSPADFGGQRGEITPIWWNTGNSQFGMLKTWKITNQGSFLDDQPVSDVRFENLQLVPGKLIVVRIGVKEETHHPGGVNLFGAKSGNYPQDLVLKIYFRRLTNWHAQRCA